MLTKQQMGEKLTKDNILSLSDIGSLNMIWKGQMDFKAIHCQTEILLDPWLCFWP